MFLNVFLFICLIYHKFIIYICSEFCNMVRRILICSSQDVKKMTGNKLPLRTAECEGISFNVENAGD